MKETELLADFIRDIFSDLLGYTGPASGLPVYTLKREALVEVDGKFADAALGRFPTAGGAATFVVAVEGKGPRDPLDRPFAGRQAVRRRSGAAVRRQSANRLVSRHQPARRRGSITRATTCSPTSGSRRRPWLPTPRPCGSSSILLAAERVVPTAGRGHLDDLLAESRRIGRELTNDYYHEHAAMLGQT